MDLALARRVRNPLFVLWTCLVLLLGLLANAGTALALDVSPTTVQLAVGASAAVRVTGAEGGVTVSSSNPAVATVSFSSPFSGVGIATIIGRAAGSATITIRDSEHQARVSVSVVSAEPLTVSPTSVQIVAGTNATVSVSNAIGTVTASSSNNAVATVSYAAGTATIHGVAAGTASVTIRDSVTARTVAVTVVPALSVSPTSVQIVMGTDATVSVSNATGAVTASSSDSAVATVSYAAGVATIHGVAPGTATITIADSATTRTVAVTVVTTLSVSPTSVQIAVGGNASVSVSNATGTVTATSSNISIATVAYANGTATIHGVAAGTATVTIRDSVTTRTVAVTVTAAAVLTVSPSSVQVAVGGNAAVSVSNATGTVTARSSNTAIATVTYASGTATIHGVAAGTATVTISDSANSRTVAVTVISANAGAYSLLAWNNLGMHCVDGVDDSVFSILPPFNWLLAQLVDKSTGRQVTAGVTLSYQAVTDTRGSINTVSSTKTNFWRYVQPIYGLSPAPDVGLTGTPMASTTPAPMSFDPVKACFEAEGIPILPYDDANRVNFYPMVQVTAKNAAGQTLASTKVVLPVSDELNCAACHASTTSTNAAANAARPAAGWVFDPNPVTDWKKNILRLHDQLQAGDPAYASALAAKGYTGGLYASALAGKPSLCGACHLSNAFVEIGYPTGVAGVKPLTQSLHTLHASAVLPASGLTLDNLNNRDACYQCHPGSTTQCMRGAMSTLLAANGSLAINCQSCHGNMSKVGSATRDGWFAEPNCQACHHDGLRDVSAVDANGNLKIVSDTRFATTPNKPFAGYSLFRYSTGHGNLQCEACHGATHAEYPTTEDNDNVQSISLQGYAGTVRECSVCHSSVPLTGNAGPHGIHTVGASWVSAHPDRISSSGGLAACAYCHGANFRGSPLAVVKVAKTLNGRNYAAGQQVTCYDCHNGPSGD